MTLQDVQEGEEVYHLDLYKASTDPFLQIVVSYGYELSESPEWYKAEWERSPVSRAGVSFNDWESCRVKLGPGGQILTSE